MKQLIKLTLPLKLTRMLISYGVVGESFDFFFFTSKKRSFNRILRELVMIKVSQWADWKDCLMKIKKVSVFRSGLETRAVGCWESLLMREMWMRWSMSRIYGGLWHIADPKMTIKRLHLKAWAWAPCPKTAMMTPNVWLTKGRDEPVCLEHVCWK